jgi:hypothetical protein
MRHVFLALLLTLSAVPVLAATLDGLAVDVENRSEPVLCAEKDNVTVTFTNPQVRQFTMEAAHPAYIGALVQDRHAPDWTACGELNEASSHVPPLRRVTLYETADLWLTGYVYANFWRPQNVPFTVAGKTENGLSIVQLWVRRNERAEEVLVLYPADGYWRMRPLPPAHLGWSAYGSSHLIGPVEQEGRPLVRIKTVTFDPEKREFTLDFVRGGTARIRMSHLDTEKQILDIRFDPAVTGVPFAALRSMYVTQFNADAAHMALRPPKGQSWIEEPIMSARNGPATDIWIGRLTPSRHNTSAPDLFFRAFRP